MKKICLVLSTALLFLAFCGCTANGSNESDTALLSADFTATDYGIMAFPSDITDISDFQCDCSLNDGPHFTINGDNAEKLYSIITDIYRHSTKSEF